MPTRLVATTRRVAVTIPDIDDNEAFVRHCAELLLQGKRVVVLEVSRGIPDAAMPATVAACEEVLARRAFEIRSQITRLVTPREA